MSTQSVMTQVQHSKLQANAETRSFRDNGSERSEFISQKQLCVFTYFIHVLNKTLYSFNQLQNAEAVRQQKAGWDPAIFSLDESAGGSGLQSSEAAVKDCEETMKSSLCSGLLFITDTEASKEPPGPIPALCRLCRPLVGAAQPAD